MPRRYCGDVTITITTDKRTARYKMTLTIPARKKRWHYYQNYGETATPSEFLVAGYWDILARWALLLGVGDSEQVADAAALGIGPGGNYCITSDPPTLGAVYVDRDTNVKHVRKLPGWYAVCGEHLKRPTCHRHHTRVRVTCLSCLAGTKF